MGTLYEAARIECRFGNNFVTAAVTSSVSVCADQEWTTIFFILKLPISQGSQSITCKAPPFNYGVRVPLSITLNRWLSRRLISFIYHFAEEVCRVQSGLQHHFRLLDLPVVIGRKLHDRTRFVLYTKLMLWGWVCRIPLCIAHFISTSSQPLGVTLFLKCGTKALKYRSYVFVTVWRILAGFCLHK